MLALKPAILGVEYTIWLDQPVSAGVVRAGQVVPWVTLAWITSGEKVNESPRGLNRMVGRKLGAMPRPAITVPKEPDRLTLASRENMVSVPKRPVLPESMRRKPVRATLAFRPPPRSSVPFMPHQEVVMPLLPTLLVLLASPAMRMEPTYMSAKPMS